MFGQLQIELILFDLRNTDSPTDSKYPHLVIEYKPPVHPLFVCVWAADNY